MKNNIIAVILFACTMQGYTQESDIYIEVLSRFTTLLDTDYRWKADKIYIEETKGITDNFPTYSGRYSIIILDNERRDSLLEKSNSIYMYRFLPMELKKGEFIIGIIGFSYMANGITICNAGYRYCFKYDCQENKLVYIKYEGGGI